MKMMGGGSETEFHSPFRNVKPTLLPVVLWPKTSHTAILSLSFFKCKMGSNCLLEGGGKGLVEEDISKDQNCWAQKTSKFALGILFLNNCVKTSSLWPGEMKARAAGVIETQRQFGSHHNRSPRPVKCFRELSHSTNIQWMLHSSKRSYVHHCPHQTLSTSCNYATEMSVSFPSISEVESKKISY